MPTIGRCRVDCISDGRTPLIVACANGRWAAAKALLDHPNGPPDNVLHMRDKYGCSAFLYVFGSGRRAEEEGVESEEASAARLAVADALRARGVDTTVAETEGGYTALHVASGKENEASVAYLLKHVPQLLNVADKQGRTPLWYSARDGFIQAARMLLDAGANASTRDKEGISPLSSAAAKGHLPIVQLLVERGANVVARDGSGRRPLELAHQEGHDAVVTYLAVRRVCVE